MKTVQAIFGWPLYIPCNDFDSTTKVCLIRF